MYEPVSYTIQVLEEYHKYFDAKHSEKQKPRTEIKGIHPLKPWKDPESLFCDTEFLRKITGKEPTKGDECKDSDENK